MAREGLMKGIAEGQFSEHTLDLLQLEGALPLSELSATRDAFEAKVTAATGMDASELEELYESDRAGFAMAAQELLKTGSTSAFQALADRARDAAYVPLGTEQAMTAWMHEDFPQALRAAGIEPNFDGPELAIEVPGRGVVKWADAVRLGLVKVSRL